MKRINTDIRRFLRAACDVILPRVCVVCGERLNLEERHICLGCLADMPLTRFWDRKRNPMADKFNEKIQEWVQGKSTSQTRQTGNTGKTTTSGKHEPYAYAAALFFYHSEAGYRHIPYQIKYHGNIKAGQYFGTLLGRKLTARKGENENSGPWTDVDIIIPVPLHWTRKWKRGYNQAEMIAGAMAEAMGVRMRTDILERRRKTKTQIKLGIEDKERNVAGAFAVRERIRPDTAGTKDRKDHDIMNARHIVLVDDVFTTGSTLASCFTALREVFPPSVRISAVTLGYLER